MAQFHDQSNDETIPKNEERCDWFDPRWFVYNMVIQAHLFPFRPPLTPIPSVPWYRMKVEYTKITSRLGRINGLRNLHNFHLGQTYTRTFRACHALADTSIRHNRHQSYGMSRTLVWINPDPFVSFAPTLSYLGSTADYIAYAKTKESYSSSLPLFWSIMNNAIHSWRIPRQVVPCGASLVSRPSGHHHSTSLVNGAIIRHDVATDSCNKTSGCVILLEVGKRSCAESRASPNEISSQYHLQGERRLVMGLARLSESAGLGWTVRSACIARVPFCRLLVSSWRLFHRGLDGWFIFWVFVWI